MNDINKTFRNMQLTSNALSNYFDAYCKPSQELVQEARNIIRSNMDMLIPLLESQIEDFYEMSKNGEVCSTEFSLNIAEETKNSLDLIKEFIEAMEYTDSALEILDGFHNIPQEQNWIKDLSEEDRDRLLKINKIDLNSYSEYPLSEIQESVKKLKTQMISMIYSSDGSIVSISEDSRNMMFDEIKEFISDKRSLLLLRKKDFIRIFSIISILRKYHPDEYTKKYWDNIGTIIGFAITGIPIPYNLTMPEEDS